VRHSQSALPPPWVPLPVNTGVLDSAASCIVIDDRKYPSSNHDRFITPTWVLQVYSLGDALLLGGAFSEAFTPRSRVSKPGSCKGYVWGHSDWSEKQLRTVFQLLRGAQNYSSQAYTKLGVPQPARTQPARLTASADTPEGIEITRGVLSLQLYPMGGPSGCEGVPHNCGPSLINDKRNPPAFRKPAQALFLACEARIC
jgi:hypothetical protein